MKLSEYLSVTQFAEKTGVDRPRVLRWIKNGRISAVKVGATWVISADEPKPADARVKSGEYRNWRKPKEGDENPNQKSR
jgi:excisionase family DNA binding protein